MEMTLIKSLHSGDPDVIQTSGLFWSMNLQELIGLHPSEIPWEEELMHWGSNVEVPG
jgi:hypothetical protein